MEVMDSPDCYSNQVTPPDTPTVELKLHNHTQKGSTGQLKL